MIPLISFGTEQISGLQSANFQCNIWCVFIVNTEAELTLSYSFNSGQVGYCGYLIIM
jgi:hypothetical protein